MKNIVIVVDMQNGFTRYGQTKKLTERIIFIEECINVPMVKGLTPM